MLHVRTSQLIIAEDGCGIQGDCMACNAASRSSGNHDYIRNLGRSPSELELRR